MAARRLCIIQRRSPLSSTELQHCVPRNFPVVSNAIPGADFSSRGAAAGLPMTTFLRHGNQPPPHSQTLGRRNYHKQLVQHLTVTKDKDSIMKFLEKNISRYQGDIITINKPPGLAVSKRSDESDSSSSISSLMSHIAEVVNSPAIEIAQGLEKETSGLVLLGASRPIADKLQASMHEARRKWEFIRTYKAIVCGIPKEKEGMMKAYLATDVIDGRQMTVIRRHPSNKQIRNGDVWSAETRYRVVSENEDLGCALLNLQPLRVKRHQLQVQLIDLLCPILGDHVYSHQVRTILDVPMLQDPYQIQAEQHGQMLSRDLRKALLITPGPVSRLPLFLHLHQLLVPRWREGRDVELVAPLPAHFTRALKQLGLTDSVDMGGEEVKQLTAR